MSMWKPKKKTEIQENRCSLVGYIYGRMWLTCRQWLRGVLTLVWWFCGWLYGKWSLCIASGIYAWHTQKQHFQENCELFIKKVIMKVNGVLVFCISLPNHDVIPFPVLVLSTLVSLCQMFWVSTWLLFNANSAIFQPREQVIFQWYFVLVQHT
jgi:hypothetical protein